MLISLVKQFADKNGIPKYKHLLCPRTKGFSLTVELLHGAVDCLYDLTVQYPDCGNNKSDGVGRAVRWKD